MQKSELDYELVLEKNSIHVIIKINQLISRPLDNISKIKFEFLKNQTMKDSNFFLSFPKPPAS